MVCGARTLFPTINNILRKGCFVHQIAIHSVSSALRVSDNSDENDASAESSSHICHIDQCIHQMRSFAKQGRVEEALETLNNTKLLGGISHPSVRDYNALIYCYLKSPNVEFDKLNQLFSCIRRNGLCPDAVTYNTVFNGMMLLGQFQEAFSILEDMHRDGYLPSFQSLSRLVKKFLESGNLKDSVSVVKFMVLLDKSPTEPVLNSLFLNLGKAGMINKACYILNSIVCKGYYVSAFVYNPILWALCKRGQPDVALSYICSFKKRGLICNVCSYTALVYGFGMSGLWKDTSLVWSEMETVGSVPNAITYTSKIKHLCKHGRVKEALDLLKKMERDGPDPDMITYSIILLELLNQLLSSSPGRRLKPDLYTYAALTGGVLKQGNLSIANEFSFDICNSDIVVYNMHIQILCLYGRMKEALSLLKVREEGAIRPNIISYNIVVKGLCLKGNFLKALELLDKCEALNGPDVGLYNTILSEACKLKKVSDVKRILNTMEGRGVKPNVISYTCLIKFYCDECQSTECSELVENMLNDGPTPTTPTLNVLINGLCKNQSLEEAYSFLQRFQDARIAPNTTTYNILIDTNLRLGHDMVVEDLLKKMSSSGLERDLVTYNTILKHKLRTGKLQGALSLIENMFCHDYEPDDRTREIVRSADSKGLLKNSPHGKKILKLVLCANTVKETYHIVK